jgi:hypothetical protein
MVDSIADHGFRSQDVIDAQSRRWQPKVVVPVRVRACDHCLMPC